MHDAYEDANVTAQQQYKGRPADSGHDQRQHQHQKSEGPRPFSVGYVREALKKRRAERRESRPDAEKLSAEHVLAAATFSGHSAPHEPVLNGGRSGPEAFVRNRHQPLVPALKATEDPVVIFEVHHQYRKLIRNLLHSYTQETIPEPYFIILADASFVPAGLTDEQLEDAGFFGSWTGQVKPLGCFSGVVLTVLSYNSNGQNGLLRSPKDALGSDVRFFHAPFATTQMFDGISLLISDPSFLRLKLEIIATESPTLLRRVTRCCRDCSSTGHPVALALRSLPSHVCETFRAEARISAARLYMTSSVVRLGKMDRCHVYNGWLFLLQDILHANVLDQTEGSEDKLGMSWRARHKSLRGLARTSLLAEVQQWLDETPANGHSPDLATFKAQ